MIGPLPLALSACLEIVGGVNLCGDGGNTLPQVGYHHAPHEESDLYPDPLALPPGRHLPSMWEKWASDKGDIASTPREFCLLFAPDEIHKANVSGGQHDILLPNRSADPEPLYVPGRKGITLVEYLLISLAWGGFPGHDITPLEAPIPRMIEELRRDLLMF
jgi:hypothetical protein